MDNKTYDIVNDHYKEACGIIDPERIIICALHGSQNYGLELENSDVDTKALIAPSFSELCGTRPLISMTHVRANKEHIDIKDYRKYFDSLHKQNLNFLEILFTPYIIVNPIYEFSWQQLCSIREEIVRLNPHRAVRTAQGVANNRYKKLYTPTEVTAERIEKFGYDGKSAGTIVRLYDFLLKYISQDGFESCIKPEGETKDKILSYKKQEAPLDIMKADIDKTIAAINLLANSYYPNEENIETCAKLLNISKLFMRDTLYQQNIIYKEN